MKASDLLMRCLEQDGVTRIYGVTGKENADFMGRSKTRLSILF